MLSHTPRRTTQPYADPSQRPQTPQLAAMLGGRSLYGQNPADDKRQMQHLAALILGHGVRF